MNHDVTHCADHTTRCPKSCFRAQVTEEIKRIYYPFPQSWAHFKGTEECPLGGKKEVENETQT